MRFRNGPIFGLLKGNVSLITGRFTVLPDLLQRLPVHPRLAENLALTDLLNQNTTTNLCPLFHVSVHPLTSESDHFRKG